MLETVPQQRDEEGEFFCFSFFFSLFLFLFFKHHLILLKGKHSDLKGKVVGRGLRLLRTTALFMVPLQVSLLDFFHCN